MSTRNPYESQRSSQIGWEPSARVAGANALPVADHRPEAVAQRQLIGVMNSSSQVRQLKAVQERADIHAVTNGNDAVIQRAVAPSYAAKAHRPAHTAIPTTATGAWKRPEWLRGQRGAVTTLINDLIADGKVERSPENRSYIRDNFTGAWVPLIGVNIDHIIDWAAFARDRGVTDLQELEEAYHEMDNMQVSASRTNSSNSQTDVLEWMAGPSHEEYMGMMENPRGQERMGSLIGEIADQNPFMTMQDVPEQRRSAFLGHLGTIQNPRSGMSMEQPVDGLNLLMAFAHARAAAHVQPDMSHLRERSPEPDADEKMPG